jgi:DNA-binding XRE family transcriptional regulator
MVTAGESAVGIGGNLIRLLAERGMDDLDLLTGLKARRSGIAAQTLYHIKTNRRRPSLGLAQAIAGVLNERKACTLDELVGPDEVGPELPGAISVPSDGEER